MKSQLLPLGSVFVAAVLMTDVRGVRRPDYMSHARMAPEYFDHDVFDKEVTVKPATTAPPVSHNSVMNSEKCCKVGERVAKEGLYCSYDIHVVSRTPNFIQRYKLKQYSHSSSKSQVRVFKNLTMRIAKCHHHKVMFEKCCNYRSSFMISMRRCRELQGKDRRQCRLKTRKTFNV